MPETHFFLDTSALFAAVMSPTGGARELLRLGELGMVTLSVGPRVLAEAEEVFRRKAPHLLPSLAVLLTQANIRVSSAASAVNLTQAEAVVAYGPDARVLAEALEAKADFFVTHDQTHFPAVQHAQNLSCKIGSPGDALRWLREQIKPEE